jgi:hypothetical protein
VRFNEKDVVRHPLVGRIVEAYDKRIYPKGRRRIGVRPIDVSLEIAGDWPGEADAGAMAGKAVAAAVAISANSGARTSELSISVHR